MVGNFLDLVIIALLAYTPIRDFYLGRERIYIQLRVRKIQIKHLFMKLKNWKRKRKLTNG